MYRMGRYCLHWHLNGKASKSYVLNASVHNSFNRAVAVHGTHSVTVRNTVAYKVKGHAFFLEDGEWSNFLVALRFIHTFSLFALQQELSKAMY